MSRYLRRNSQAQTIPEIWARDMTVPQRVQSRQTITQILGAIRDKGKNMVLDLSLHASEKTTQTGVTLDEIRRVLYEGRVQAVGDEGNVVLEDRADNSRRGTVIVAVNLKDAMIITVHGSPPIEFMREAKKAEQVVPKSKKTPSEILKPLLDKWKEHTA